MESFHQAGLRTVPGTVQCLFAHPGGKSLRRRSLGTLGCFPAEGFVVSFRKQLISLETGCRDLSNGWTGLPQQRLYLRVEPQGQGSCGRPFPAGLAGERRGHFVSQRVEFFRDRVEFCGFGELPALFEDGEGGP